MHEEPGQGVRGEVDGHHVAVGKAAWAGQGDPSWVAQVRGRAAVRGAITVFVGVDGRLAGVLLLQDRVRPDAARTFRLLRRTGIDRAVMVAVVRAESARAPTVMVGDGVNDAPALAAAGVGVALGARGASASSQAADVVITVDRLERLAEALAIARRTQAVAGQSVLAGMGLSLAAMVVAAFGLLTPAVGAVVQEGIDVAAILGALRALGPGRDRLPRLRGDAADLVRRLDEEHRALWPRVERLPALADAVTGPSPEERRAAVAELTGLLDDLLAHERTDEQLLYPAVARTLGGADPTGTMSREHEEIAALARRVRLLCAELGADPADDTPGEFRRSVQELHAILRLHFAQEEESYFVLADAPGDRSRETGNIPPGV
ncbi:heavy metal translocating P-type ATPase [Thermomonospora cellulosilytica]|uniref:Iron-sulfur cluster repair protein YtfE (RIC family) n=1 Tax=Thermomonospora cellulosilytica TaxID=1411118 RepID=A0A7W3MVV0_9ACTN|nr:hemerythrin domain-containing protein [Thermomonospora cellulosilytica]MBA9002779.1 iron-sulfur cluster repair protein YtfE (RIC family) [Thermomonospora cellulosilytica]